MKLHRRSVLRLAAGAAALPVMPYIARAQAYPSRPVRIIVGLAAGGGLDVLARLLGQWLSERLGQPFVVEHCLGAGGNIATEAFVKEPADGYTLLMLAPSQVINAALYEKLNYNFARDIAPIASIIRLPSVMLVNPLVPAKTVPEFITYAKANPGKINMASARNGTTQHVFGELFKVMTGIDMIHVPYHGASPALTGMIDGRAQVMFDSVSASIKHIRAGTLRALAVTTKSRVKELSDIPVLADFVPGYEASGWQGIGAPRKTPLAIIEMLNKEVNAAFADPVMKARLAELGGTPFVGSRVDFEKLVVSEAEKWSNVIRAANIKNTV